MRTYSNNNSFMSGSFAGLFMLGFITLILFASYYGSINSYNHVWKTAQLDLVSIRQDTSCARNKDGTTTCSTYYYINEHFTKFENGNKTSSGCTIERPTTYYSYSAALNKQAREKLYTFRKVYVYPLTQVFGNCADDGLIKYYYDVSYTMLGVSLFCIFCCFLIIFMVMFENFAYQFQKSGRTYDPNSNKTNLSSSWCCASWNRFWAYSDLDGNGVIDFYEFLAAITSIFSLLMSNCYKDFISLMNYLVSFCRCCSCSPDHEDYRESDNQVYQESNNQV